MRQKEIFDFVKQGDREFKDISKMREQLEELLGPYLILPIIAGEKDLNKRYWKRFDASLLDKPSELTIRNYLGGLSMIENSRVPSEYSGRISYNFIPKIHESYCGTSILFARIFNSRDGSQNQAFGLKLYFSRTNEESIGNVGYKAYSYIPETHVEEDCKRFRGPNISRD